MPVRCEPKTSSWWVSAPEASAPPYSITSSLAAGKTASIAISTNTAHTPWWARNEVTRPSLAAEVERRRRSIGPDGSLTAVTRATYEPGGAGAPSASVARPRCSDPARLEPDRGSACDDRAALRLDLQRHRRGSARAEPRCEPAFAPRGPRHFEAGERQVEAKRLVGSDWRSGRRSPGRSSARCPRRRRSPT